MLSRQQRQVLDALRSAGRHGVHSFDLRHAGIGNPSQRVAELEQLGVLVDRRRERLRAAVGVRWTLISAPASLSDRPVSESPPSTPPPRPSCRPVPGGGDSDTGVQLDLLGAHRG